MKLKVATCQFPTSANIGKNLQHILGQIRDAKDRGADVVHFPEACLSGYAGQDFASYKGFNWGKLAEATPRVIEFAKELQIWIILGSTHKLSRENKPHNSVYIINDRGKLIDRYDKMFCAGDRLGKTGELAHYSPGNHFSVFNIKGVRCGVLICHEYRYPELYREYKKKGVQLIFHSYHAGHFRPEQFRAMQEQVGTQFHKLNRGTTLPGITMPATMQATAASNHVWISCSNSSARESCWASFFVRPDGVITGRLRRNIAGVLISEVNDQEEFYDSTIAWRDRAMRGIYHSGKLVQDRRSTERRRL
ncbi:MAG: carbon-nitrogen hydrolase family protein [bacterium]|nr:carbon-nitrogen hydrolase family protein [bacterium]